MTRPAHRNSNKEGYWRRMVAEHEKSKLTYRAWCRREGVNEGTFSWWRRELARRDGRRPASPFVAVDVIEERPKTTAPSIEIDLTDGRRVRVTGQIDRQALADVMDVLEPRS